MVLSGAVMVRQKPWASSWGRSIGWSLILLAVCCIPSRFGLNPKIPVPIDGGGYLGALCKVWMDNHLAQAGAVILVLSMLIGGLLLSTEYALLRYFGYAATGSMIAINYFRVPSWSLRRHREILSGTFSPKRADLPNSLTMRQDPTSISTTISPFSAPKPSTGLSFPSIRSAVQSVTQALTTSASSVPTEEDDSYANTESVAAEGGPSIRIGRRATASISAADLATEPRNSVRTDLSFPKPKNPTLSTVATTMLGTNKSTTPPVDDELLDNDADEQDHEYEDEEEYDVEQEEAYEDKEGYEDEEDEVHSEEEEPDEVVVESPKKSKNVTVRSDAARIEERVPTIKNNKTKKAAPKEEEEDPAESLQHMDDTKLPEGSEEYVLPGLDLLTESDDISYDEQTEEVKRKAKVLEETFKNFGFNVRVVEIETGPVIAQYEIELEAGLRLSKITGLADDLAIALRVPSVRIVAPIPGKNSVGIEVPNEQRQIVRMREVIEESGPQIKKQKIPLFLGKDVSGKSLTVDLASLPHLLIAGRTGTGKSV
jgi:DNA segregation ATPase FtsK/SpoIIIE-like protein